MLAMLALKKGFRQFLTFLSLRVLVIAITICMPSKRLCYKKNTKAFKQDSL